MDAVITSTAPLIIIELLAVLLNERCGVMVWGFARAPQMDGAAVGAFETISARYACGFARAIPWPLDGRSNAARATRINDLAGGMARFSTGWPNDTDTLGLKEMRTAAG